MSASHQSRIFAASCVALIVTAMTFAIRAGILDELSLSFDLSDTQLGWINSMAFLGFPLATMIGGLIYNLIGPKKMMYVAFAGHVLGLALTITAGGFWGLLISTFCIGFANGSVEAACNPLIVDIYHDNKTTMLNRFHVWFPGGIVIGALAAAAMGAMGFGWQLQIAIMLVPTAIYGFMIVGLEFPPMSHSEMSTATNIRSLFSPLYIFMLICMSLTAVTELGTQQWVERILGASGAHPMLVLAMVTGLMAVGRQFAGPVIYRLHPPGVLLASAVIATIGIYAMSIASGPMVYLAAILFAVGVMYFWPTMLGFIGEYQPRTGALGMSLIGGVGMFATGIWQPVIGGWLDGGRDAAVAEGLVGNAVELAAGRATLDNLALFPLALIVLFAALIVVMKKQGIKPIVSEQVALDKAAEMPQP
ncbi:MAG TPA: MFS transporter [Gammaproteobacteria bacterium]|nr:MFS transporter [Gammaproteobacteria bacterium]